MTEDDFTDIEARLERERPLPAPGFRGELRRAIADRRVPARPARLRLLIAANLGSGAVLLAIAAVGAGGGF